MSSHHHHHHPAQHPAPTTPATAAPSEPAYTPLNWSFPFKPAGKDDATDPMTYMKALAKAEDGFFPLGISGMCHGGIHFDRGTAEMLKQDEGVQAIADGEVVAYRIDSKYPQQSYQDGRQALYSTGFVLIRHKLQLPPAPSPQSSGSASTSPSATSAHPPTSQQAASPSSAASSATSTPPDETLIFFSLYMHLLDWEGYQSQRGAAHPTANAPASGIVPLPYWEGDRYYRVGNKAKDKQEVPTPKVQQIPASTSSGDTLGDFINAGFVIPQQSTPQASVQDAQTPVAVEGIRIRDLPNGKVIGILPKGGELTISETDPQHPGWGKIKSIRTGQPVAPVAGQQVSGHAPWSWVYVNELDAVADPNPLDAVVILKQPFKVKAGDIVGHMGQYLRYADAKLLKAQPTRPQLHVEVFAGPELKAFVQKSQARAKQLPPSKSFLEISPGARFVTTIPKPDQTVPLQATGLKLVPVGVSEGSCWIKVQPKKVSAPTSGAAHPHGAHHSHHPAQTLTNVGTPLWVDASLAGTTTTQIVKGWSTFPLRVADANGPGADFRDVFRRAELEKIGPENIAIDDNGHHWWNVTIGSKSGVSQQGWVCEVNHPLTRMCGSWDWPGFEFADNSSMMPVDMFKRFLHVTDQYLEDEGKSEFEPSALKVNASELIIKLEKAIDTNQDGKVTAQELKHAQETPWMAEAITHLIVCSETEWGGGLGKWEDLSPTMKKLLWLWKAEVERIGKLQWWEQASGVDGFPKELRPWHLHPIGLVGNFNHVTGALDELIQKIGDAIAGGEGGYESYNTGTKDVPNGAVGHSYMNRPVGTVTSKTIDEILATDPLSGTNPNRMFATGKYQTTLYTLRGAKAAMGLTGSEKYDAEMQERVFREYLFNKAGGGGLAAFVRHGRGTIDDAQMSAAQEWASIAAPQGRQISDGRTSDGHMSYYQGSANSNNDASTAKLRDVLNQVAAMRG